MRKISLAIIVILTCLNLSGCYLFTPLSRIPTPADFVSLYGAEKDGKLFPLALKPDNIYGMGLTYATHLKETGQEFDKDTPPPVFKKSLSSLNPKGAPVKIPSREELIASAEQVEPGLGEKIEKDFEELPPLLDYEVELAFVLLEDVNWRRIKDPAYSPDIGYFIANDISARTIAMLGEGRGNRYEYWGASKSFPNFLPIGTDMWVPDENTPESIPDIEITTIVNGIVRQKQSTRDMMYTPREMLFFISKEYPQSLPEKGDIVLTGTPGGVALQVPPWKTWLANTLRLDRFAKLTLSILSGKKNEKFLKTGDIVEISGGILGTVKTKIQ